MKLLEFPSTEQFSAAIFLSVINTAILLFITFRMLHIFQLNGYKQKNFLTWIFDRRARFYIRLTALSLLSFGSLAVINVIFHEFKGNILWSYLSLVFYFFFCAVFIINIWRAKVKVDLKVTPRIRRLIVALSITYFLITLFVVWMGSTYMEFVRFSMIAFLPMLTPFILLFCSYILYPYEALVHQHYLRKATKKMMQPEFSNLIRIGITGSWGKTSCKNILKVMLSEKYKVVASPASYNTPMGLAKTINNLLSPDDEIIVMEMGARYVYDIRDLARIFKPHHGIMTAIGAQHVDTFKSLDNVKKGKSELLKALPIDSGIAVTNGDNERCREVYHEIGHKNKFLSALEKDKDTEAWVEDISITQDGCQFKLCFRNQQPVQCQTMLLGLHNIENILMCAVMANKLGVSAEQIANAVSKLKSTAHRLELIKADNGVLILDDSYNASPGGTRAALDVLALFKGKKVIMTPGMVELGTKEAEENFRFGNSMAAVADKVIIVNEINKTAIYDGLLSGGFKKEDIYTVPTLDEAKKIYADILSPGDVLLIENDLPDNYL
jgi:UDP-N-acetylmuramoyl-tripeptide--D-alanyl-D-alanine ligase